MDGGFFPTLVNLPVEMLGRGMAHELGGGGSVAGHLFPELRLGLVMAGDGPQAIKTSWVEELRGVVAPVVRPVPVEQNGGGVGVLADLSGVECDVVGEVVGAVGVV